mmetsp:Transcript_34973/g.96716  ORF Transcript_34973/g.96716 Transcript_34973/m.96716 type:complete len:257 (-) Transcript_34973:20-790(-)
MTPKWLPATPGPPRRGPVVPSAAPQAACAPPSAFPAATAPPGAAAATPSRASHSSASPPARAAKRTGGRLAASPAFQGPPASQGTPAQWELQARQTLLARQGPPARRWRAARQGLPACQTPQARQVLPAQRRRILASRVARGYSLRRGGPKTCQKLAPYGRLGPPGKGNRRRNQGRRLWRPEATRLTKSMPSGSSPTPTNHQPTSRDGSPDAMASEGEPQCSTPAQLAAKALTSAWRVGTATVPQRHWAETKRKRS